MSWMSIVAKNTKTPRKMQTKQQPTENQKNANNKMSVRGPDFTFSLPWERLAPLPP